MQNNQQQSEQKQQQGGEKERESTQNNLPSNFPRFSVQIPSPSKGSISGSHRQSKKNDQFQGFAKRMENTTKQDDDSMSLISAIPQLQFNEFKLFNNRDESALNETIGKELHKERNLILQYVNSSLNDHTIYIKDLGKDIKDQQQRNKDLAEKQSLMLRTQVSAIESNNQVELEQMNQKFTMMFQDMKSEFMSTLQDKENRIYNYCSELEKRIEGKLTSINQRIQLQIDMKDNKLNEGQSFKKLDADIQNINNKIVQIQQLQNLDDLTGFNAQLAILTQEVQQIKQQMRKQKDDHFQFDIFSQNEQFDVRIVEANENTKQYLKSNLSQNSNNLISNQNYKDKIFEGQIEEIQRYINGFSKVVQYKLNISNEDLNLYLENDNNNYSQKGGQKNPFSFGGGYNMQNQDRVSTLGTMQSAEFEVKENNKLILKQEKGSYPSTPNPHKQQQKPQQQQLLNPVVQQQQQLSYQQTNASGRMSNSPARLNNQNSNDYYNIFNETAPTQQFTPQTYHDSSYQSQQQQPQKKKKKIFGDEVPIIPPMMNNPQRQNRNTNPSPSRGQHTQKIEQKNIIDSQAMDNYTQKTESDQVIFETIPNKESFQSQQGYYSVPHPVLESKLSVKVNENVEVFNDMNELTDSDSDEQPSISNFRLKDTRDFIQREVIQGISNQGNQISPFQQQQQLLQQQPQVQQQQNNINQNQIYQNQQNINVKSAAAETLMKHNQLNQSPSSNNANNASSAANHKRLNTIQELEQEYSGKKNDQQNQLKNNNQLINNYMTNKIESIQPNIQQKKQNSYENYEDFKINIPQSEIQFDNDISAPQNKGTPKHKITNEGLNFMIASKGKSSFNQANQQSNLNGLLLNENEDNFKPKWGYDSQVSRSEAGDEIEYQLDENGYLLDENGQFLLDDNGQKIQLNQDNINFLAQNKMLYDA